MTESFRLGRDGIYRCEAFQQFIWQEHGFGTRTANPRADVTLRQIHSDGVVNAHNLRDRDAEGDALVTDALNLAIGVRSADCVPILLLDTKRRALAAVHAGWKGSSTQIAARTVERMGATFGTDPGDVLAAMGPCVRGCCYEVGEEVAEKFSALFPEWGEEDVAKRKLDLPQANRRALISAGVPDKQIFDSCLCTACEPAQFFSYRREPANEGRMVSSIMRLS